MYNSINLLTKGDKLAWQEGSDKSPSIQLIKDRVSETGDAMRYECRDCSLEPVHVVDDDIFKHGVENSVDITTTDNARHSRLEIINDYSIRNVNIA